MDENNTSNTPSTQLPQFIGDTEAHSESEQQQVLSTQNTSKLSKKWIILLILVFTLALMSAGFFVYLNSQQKSILNPLSKGFGSNSMDSSDKTIQNPITGLMYTPQEAESWLTDRPLGVMVNNHVDARPQSGLIYSDIVYEIVAEGGITRYLAFFLTDTPEKIGPVRSTRHYYLMLVKELGDAMIMHEGYSPQALEAIETWPVRSLQRGGASAIANWRDNPRNVAVEHTLYTNGEKLREFGDELGWEGNREFVIWNFKDDDVKPLPTVQCVTEPCDQPCYVGECTPITIDFWFEGDYSAIWKYNNQNNTYLRFLGYDANGNPIAHADQETGEQIEVKNLIVQFVPESNIEGDDKSRLNYDLIGSGSGILFIDGEAIPLTWAKQSRDERTMFYDENGEEIEFNRGKFWVALVPDRNVDQVNY